MEYYNWQATLSYNADVSMVIGARGIGKTYGLRLQCIKDHIRDGSCFVEICRYKSELGPIMDGYFSRLAEQFPNYIFKTEKLKGYIAEAPEEGSKPSWRTICYFIALTDSQNAKKRTYNNVRRIIFDEAILEAYDRHHKYIPREYIKLANVVDTLTRERPDSDIRPHLYLLSNAVDLINPYFIQYGINKMPEFGYTWYRNKTVLVHYVDPGEYASLKIDNTLSGRMIKGTAEEATAARNLFDLPAVDLIAKKPKAAKFELGFIDSGNELGIWADYVNGYYYVNSKIPNNTDKPVYYVCREDATANILAARRASNWMRAMSDAHYLNMIRYENHACRSRFLDMLQKFGLA